MRLEYSIYFGVYDNIGGELKLEVQGLDMFLYREGTQKDLKPRIFESNNYNNFNDLNSFANAQLDLFIEVLNITFPKVILLANAFVSDIFKFKFGNYLNRKPGEDFHLYKEIPIFFSSMLSGAHQLDKHSRERLIWQMKSSLT